MNRFAILAVIVGSGACAAAWQARPAPESPREPVRVSAEVARVQEQQTTMDIDAALNEFHDAASKSDAQRYFALWTPESVFLGTDATERWVGAEFEAFARPYFEKGKGWTYRPRDRRITSLPGGSAYFDELLENDKLGVCRGSGVVRVVDGRWKVMQYNLSIPIPNDLAERVVGLIRSGAPKEPEGERKHQE